MLAERNQYPIRVMIPVPTRSKSKQEEGPWDQLVNKILREFPRTGKVAQFVRHPRSLEIHLYTFTSEQETWLNEQIGNWEARTDEKAPAFITDEQIQALQKLKGIERELSILQERYDRMVEEERTLHRLTKEQFGIQVYSSESFTSSDGDQTKESLWHWEHVSGEKGYGFLLLDEARLAGIKWSVLHERDQATK